MCSIIIPQCYTTKSWSHCSILILAMMSNVCVFAGILNWVNVSYTQKNNGFALYAVP